MDFINKNTFADKSRSAGVSVTNPDFDAAATAGVKIPLPPDPPGPRVQGSPASVQAGEQKVEYFQGDEEGFIEVKSKKKKTSLASDYKRTVVEVRNANSLLKAQRMTIRNVQKFTFASRLWHDVKVERFENGQSTGFVNYGDRGFMGTPVVKVHGSRVALKCWERPSTGSGKKNFCSYTLSEGTDRFGKPCPVAHFKLCTFHEYSKQFNLELAQRKAKQQQEIVNNLRTRLAGLDTIKFLRSKPKPLDNWEKEIKVWDSEDLQKALELWFEFGIYTFAAVDIDELYGPYGPAPESVSPHPLGVQFAVLPKFENPCVRMWHVVNTAISHLAKRKGIMVFIPISRIKLYLCGTVPGKRNPGMAVISDLVGGELPTLYCYNISMPDFEEGGHILIPDRNVYIENTSAIRKYVERPLPKWTAIIIEDEALRRLFYKAAVEKFRSMPKENFCISKNAENPKMRKIMKPAEVDKLWPAIEAFVNYRAINPDRSFNYMSYIGRVTSFDRHGHIIVNENMVDAVVKTIGERGGHKPDDLDDEVKSESEEQQEKPKPVEGNPSVVPSASGDKIVTVALKKEQKLQSDVVDLMSEKPFDNKTAPVVKGTPKTKSEKNRQTRERKKQKRMELKQEAAKSHTSIGQQPSDVKTEVLKPIQPPTVKKHVPLTFEAGGVRYSLKGVAHDWKVNIPSSGWCAFDCVIHTLQHHYPEIFAGQGIGVMRELVAFYARISSSYSSCPDTTQKILFENQGWMEREQIVQTFLAFGLKGSIFEVKDGLKSGDMLKIVKTYEGENSFKEAKQVSVIFYNRHFEVIKPYRCSELIAEPAHTLTVHASYLAHGGINYTRGKGWDLSEQCKILLSRFVAERSAGKTQASVFFKRQYCTFAMWSFSASIGLIQLYPATQIANSQYRDVVTKQPLDATEVKTYAVIRSNYPALKPIIPQPGFMKEIQDEVAAQPLPVEPSNETKAVQQVLEEVKNVEEKIDDTKSSTDTSESSSESASEVDFREAEDLQADVVDAIDLAKCAFRIGSHAASIHCMNESKPKEDPKERTIYYHNQHDFDVAVSNIEEKYREKLAERERELTELHEQIRDKVFKELQQQIEVDKIRIESLEENLSAENKKIIDEVQANNVRLAAIVELTTKLQGYVEAMDTKTIPKRHWILRALDFILSILGFRDPGTGGGESKTQKIYNAITNPVDTTKTVASYVKHKTIDGYSVGKKGIVNIAHKMNPFKHGEPGELKLNVELKQGEASLTTSIKSRYWNWAIKAKTAFRVSLTKTLGRFGFDREVNVDVNICKDKASTGVISEKGRLSTGLFTISFAGTNALKAKHVLDKAEYHRVIQSSVGKVKPYQLKWCNFLDAMHDPNQTGGGWKANVMRSLLAFSAGGVTYKYAPQFPIEEIKQEMIKETTTVRKVDSNFARNTFMKIILTTGTSIMMNAIANRHWNLLRHPKGGNAFKIPNMIDVPFRHRYPDEEIDDLNSGCIVMKDLNAKEVLADVFIERPSPPLLTQANNILWSTAVAPRLSGKGKTLTHPDFRIVEHKFWVKAHAEPTMVFARRCLQFVNSLSWIPSPVLTFSTSFLPSHWSIILSLAIGMQELLDLLIFRMTYRCVTSKYLVAFGAIGQVNYNPPALTGLSPQSIAAKRQAIQMSVTTWFNNVNMSAAQSCATKQLAAALGCQGSWEAGTSSYALARYDNSIASCIAMKRP